MRYTSLHSFLSLSLVSFFLSTTGFSGGDLDALLRAFHWLVTSFFFNRALGRFFFTIWNFVI